MYKLESRVTSHESRVDGFTLIEILISIAIVGIVFGVIITSSQAIAKSSRDSQRQSDLRNIQSALQQYYADQNFFPDDNATSIPAAQIPLVLLTSPQITSTTGNPTTPSPLKTYMSLMPKDPTSGTSTPYCYKAMVSSGSATDCDNNAISTNKCQYYELCAKLEYTPSSPSDCSLTCGANYNFKLNPL